MLDSSQILAALGKNMGEIKKYGVKSIGLFGSYARGEQRDDSDIDILVEFNANALTFRNYMGLASFLEKVLGKKVDLVIKGDIKPALRESIIGSVVYA